VFRALWIATVVSNVGTWMHDVGAAWLMAALSPDPLMVALVQAAATLPMFLLACRPGSSPTSPTGAASCSRPRSGRWRPPSPWAP
jgi:hypothetical protein